MRAYRKLAQLYHPDKRKNQKFANHKMTQINEAYAVLSNPRKRAEYDKETGFSPKAKKRGKRKSSPVSVYVDGVGNLEGAVFRDGERHGKWRMCYEDGQVEIGKFVNGEKQGKWEIRYASGNIDVGQYAQGKQHGKWTEKFANGDIFQGSYVNDKQVGQWELRFASGSEFVGEFVNGKKHGFWKEKFANGHLQFCRYNMDKEMETWIVSPEKDDAFGWVGWCLIVGVLYLFLSRLG